MGQPNTRGTQWCGKENHWSPDLKEERNVSTKNDKRLVLNSNRRSILVDREHGIIAHDW